MFIDKNDVVRKPVAYLADFEMFLPTCKETVATWKKICDKYGIIGLFPGDDEVQDELVPYVPKDDSWDEKWMAVFMHDIHQMMRSDMVIAQLDDWRSNQPDSGTLFETGWFVGKGMPAYGFLKNPSTMLERTNREKHLDKDFYYDQEGYVIEERQFPLDNMLSLVKIAETFEDACKLARADFDKKLVDAGYEPYKIQG